MRHVQQYQNRDTVESDGVLSCEGGITLGCPAIALKQPKGPEHARFLAWVADVPAETSAVALLACCGICT